MAFQDKCPKCGTTNVKIQNAVDTDEEPAVVLDDLWDAHCNNCGWDYLIVELP